MNGENNNNEEFNYKQTDWRRYVEYRFKEAEKARTAIVKSTDNQFTTISTKLDKLLNNSTHSVSVADLEKAIALHSASCPATKTNPTKNSTVEVIKDNSRFLTIIGGLVGAITLLANGFIIILKMLGHN